MPGGRSARDPAFRVWLSAPAKELSKLYWQDGLLIRDIAERFGVDEKTVMRRFRCEEIPTEKRRSGLPPGEMSRRRQAGWPPAPHELSRLYVDEGLSRSQIAARYSVPARSVGALLGYFGIAREKRAERDRVLPRQLSKDRLRDLYWGPASGYPSLGALAAKLGCGSATVRRALANAGLKIRSSREQFLIDWKSGRAPAPPPAPPEGRPCGDASRFSPEGLERLRAVMRTPEYRQKISEAQQARGSAFVPCSWCTRRIRRTASELSRYTCWFCCNEHQASLQRWRVSHPGEPRPLFLSALLDVGRALPDPNTWPAKLWAHGEEIDATEDEMVEALLRLNEERW